MKPPIFFLGFSILFWGWQSGHWVWAVMLVLLFEGNRLFNFRYKWSDPDLRRISDLCTLFCMLLFIYLLFKWQTAGVMIMLIQWFPVLLSPIMAAQVYSSDDKIDVSSLFFVLRRRRDKGDRQKPILYNLTYPYIAVCMVSASAANIRNGYFYMALAGFACWGLWVNRSGRYPLFGFFLVFILAAGTGFAGHHGLHHLQLLLERKGQEWFSHIRRFDPDPFQTRTAIGDIGTLLPSKKIIFKVQSGNRTLFPILLREASYDIYNHAMWIATRPDVMSLNPDHTRRNWTLIPGYGFPEKITVFSYLHKGEGVLKLPQHAVQINNLPAAEMKLNRFGTMKASGAPGFGVYHILLNRAIQFHSAPTEYDLHVPNKEKRVLKDISIKLGLKGRSDQAVVKVVEDFFKKKFTYTLTQERKTGPGTRVGFFLTQSKKGHCEFFATAAVLLLRTAGIPARYAKGYSVSEYSALEDRYIVRDRDAHAWARVYIDGKWRDFDATPASRINEVNRSETWWNLFSDLWYYIRFKISEWWWMEKKTVRIKSVWWILVIIFGFAAGRFIMKRKIRNQKQVASTQRFTSRRQAGIDSEFYQIEQALTQLGENREGSVTLHCWIEGIRNKYPDVVLFNELSAITDIHYQYRFDPNGISPSRRILLKRLVKAWLDRFKRLDFKPSDLRNRRSMD